MSGSDDKPVGKFFSRREFAILATGGGVGAALGVAGTNGLNYVKYMVGAEAGMNIGMGTQSAQTSFAVPQCIVRPDQIGGPYFVDQRLNRSDIRMDIASSTPVDGVPIDLTFQISQLQLNGCTALQGILVDLWQCNSVGVYSSIKEQNTIDKNFLRGLQITDKNGLVKFRTIFPGWYPTRAPHLHVRARFVSAENTISHEFGTQLYLDDNSTDEVHSLPPYAANGKRDTPNSIDPLYDTKLLLPLTKNADGSFQAFMDFGVDFS